MRRKYADCQRADGDCSICSLVSRGLDCHNRPIGRVELLRRGRGISQSDLAAATGIGGNRIRDIESGRIKTANLTLYNAVRLARALGISAEELLEDEQDG